jgi:hypothetical protein
MAWQLTIPHFLQQRTARDANKGGCSVSVDERLWRL